MSDIELVSPLDVSGLMTSGPSVTGVKTSGQVPVPERVGLAKAPTLVFIAILVLLIIALLTWALINYNKIVKAEGSNTQNPYCIRSYCSGTAQEHLYMLTPNEDPQRASYQTTNWCITNSPTTTLSNALAACSAGSASSELTSSLTSYAAFYYNDYISSCGFAWKNTNTANNLDSSNPASPNNPTGLNGVNDPFLVNLIACADANNITSSEIESLRVICGESCA
jgi:hypothetical protein